MKKISSSIPIYTIGYGSRSIEQFIEVLQQHEIAYLIDVRSAPYSRYKPEFSKEALEAKLQQHRIRYVFMGDTLGGHPDDETCYLTARKTHSQRALALGSRRELASVILQGLPNLWCGALAWWHIAQGNVGGGAVYKCASTSSTKIIRSLTT